MAKPVHKDDPKRTSRDTPKRETQTSFEDHPEAGPMMRAARAIESMAWETETIARAYDGIKADVQTARENGATWQQIGDALGITRSAAQQYYGR